MGRQLTKPSRNRHRAEKRQAVWDSLTPEQQLAELDKRLGTSVDHKGEMIGNGAKKQRAKILAMLASIKQIKESLKEEPRIPYAKLRAEVGLEEDTTQGDDNGTAS